MFKLVRRVDSPSHFAPLQVGRFEVSVQAGAGMYSRPRVTLASDEGYTEFEVAIFDQQGWIQPRTDPRFSSRAWAHRFEDGECPVAGYVSRAEVEQILADLRSLLH